MTTALITQMKKCIANTKNSENKIALDFNNDNKTEIFNNLIIPFMQLVDVDNLTDLHSILKTVLATEEETPEIDEYLNTIVSVIASDIEETDDINEQIENVVMNAFGLLFKLDEIVESTDESFNMETISTDINNYLFTFNTESAKTDTEEDDDVEEEEETEDDTTTTDEDEDVEDIVVISPIDKIDESNQGNVNKIQIKNTLQSALDTNAKGTQAVINEMYALVRQGDQKQEQQYPHHNIIDNNLVLNINGLKTAVLFLLKPANTKNLTSDEKTKIAKHLLKHYNELKLDAPPKLHNIADNKESVVMLNIKEDELKEFGQLFEVDAEDVAVYVGLMEALLTDLVNSGIVNIQDMDNDFDESFINVKLDKQQATEVVKYFDIISGDIINILNGDYDKLSYNKNVTTLNAENDKANTKIEELSGYVHELEQTISERDDEIANLTQIKNDNILNKSKFEAIVNFVKTINNVDETILQFIHNVIDAENKRDINYLINLGSSFMRQQNNNHKFRKVSMLNHATSSDINTIETIIDNTNYTSDKDEYSSGVSKNVDSISDYF